MALEKKKISDFYNPITNPMGGLPRTANSTKAIGNLDAVARRNNAYTTGSVFSGKESTPLPKNSGFGFIMPKVPAAPMSRIPTSGNTPVVAPSVPPAASSAPLFTGSKPTTSAKPIDIPQSSADAQVPPQWIKEDGSFYTPEEIATNIGNALKNSMGGGDIGTLAGNQFGAGGRSATDLQNEATYINNIRNDIASGASDPYGVGADSGIAYTPAELQAIEKAYAGIYDPAIVTAQTKLQEKQASDAAAAEEASKRDQMILQAQLDAQAPYTLGKDQVRYGANGEVIASGISSSPAFSGVYTPGSNPTVDAYVKAVNNKQMKINEIPEEYRGMVAQGLSSTPTGTSPQNTYVKQQAQTALTNIDTAMGYLENTLGGGVNTANNAVERSIFGLIPGTDATNLNAALSTIKALIGFDALQKMRESSPTGGALGNITEKELGYLQSVLGSLDVSQGTEQLKTTLSNIRESFKTLEIINSPDGTPFELDGQTYIKYGEQMYPEGSLPTQQTSMTPGTGNRPQRNNNPLNIKASEVTSQYPGVAGLDPSPASDGGQFLTFTTPEAGFEAAKRLLSNPNYQNLDVDSAMKRWSNSGYGADVAPELAGRMMSSLSPQEMDYLIRAMAQKEGYYA